jgi:mycothiol S-conjugate amidase
VRNLAYLAQMPRRPCLVAVHAHPDDESSKGAATIARYAARHPDHKRSYDATCSAFDALAHDDRCPFKLYGCRTHSPQRLRAMHEWLVASGRPSPYADALASADRATDETTTLIEIGAHVEVARRALRAHRSQVAVDDPWFFSVPLDAMRAIYPYEDYVLMRLGRTIEPAPDGYEDDLFAGVDFGDHVDDGAERATPPQWFG